MLRRCEYRDITFGQLTDKQPLLRSLLMNESRTDATQRVKDQLTNVTLPTALYDCAQIGHSCFLQAHTGLNKISAIALGVGSTVCERSDLAELH